MLELLPCNPLPVSTTLDASLAAFLLSREAMRCTSKTLAHYRYTCGSFAAWLANDGVSDVTAITPAHVRAYLVSLQRRNLRDTTQHAHARGIKTWLAWLAAEGDLARSPMQRVAMPKLEKRIPAPFSPDEVQRLLAACNRKTALGARDYAICLTLLDTGLRVAEFASLRVGDIDARNGLASVMGKGQKARQVCVGAKARAAILRMLAYRAGVKAGDALWAAYDAQGNEKGALTAHGIQVMLRRLGRKAGVEPCGPHRFRRTFALWCLRDGMDLYSLKLLMGHSTLTVLQRYLALAGEDVERAHRAHSPADKLLGA